MTFPFAPLLLFSSCLHLKLFSAYIPVCFFWQDISSSHNVSRLAPRIGAHAPPWNLLSTSNDIIESLVSRLAPRSLVHRRSCPRSPSRPQCTRPWPRITDNRSP
ncbi:hypothetical protein K466DRAFT_340579 [Polyporus arcularius HHB13444]|uniref:Secreted protein n=1 Tax=Polyporus arcularius HHB13444 TaxID=1314778 RepID=A0A5C3PMZ2_9APHY|nr:hypothetical protein K466DRAFT_340579 [Polyporus arcularius HHB13444]